MTHTDLEYGQQKVFCLSVADTMTKEAQNRVPNHMVSVVNTENYVSLVTVYTMLMDSLH